MRTILTCAAVSLAVFGTRTSTAGYRWEYHPRYGYHRVGVDSRYVGGVGYRGVGYRGVGYGVARTAAEDAGVGVGVAEAGYGRAAEGVGQYEVDHAQAEQIHQEAVTQYYQNQGLARENYEQRQQFQQQEEDAAAAANRRSHADYEAHLHQMTSAHRLTADQFDRANNIIQWPYVLRNPEFDDLRMKIDHLYAERTPDDSGVESSGFEQIQQACNAMIVIVDSHAAQLGIDAFITAKHFVQSVAYEARFKTSGGGSSASE